MCQQILTHYLSIRKTYLPGGLHVSVLRWQVGCHELVAPNPRQDRHINLFRASIKTGRGAGRQCCPARHDIVHQQNMPTDETGISRTCATNRDGPVEIGKPLVSTAVILHRCAPGPLEYVRYHLSLQVPRSDARKQNRLIVSSLEQPRPVHWDRNDESIPTDKWPRRPCKPRPCRLGKVRAIRVFELEDQSAAQILVGHCRASARPRARHRETLFANIDLALAQPRQRDPASGTRAARDEGRIAQAGPAQTEVTGNRGATRHATGRIKRPQRGLQLSLKHLNTSRNQGPVMDTPPRLTDRAALTAHRTRARRDSGAEAFLHAEALLEVQERLAEVNRSFTNPAIVTGFPEFWDDALPNATLVGDDELLDLTPGAHDLVIHALALHWADDPVGQLVQARRALGEDGLLVAVTFAGDTLHELRASFAEAETRLRGGLSPRVAPMGDLRDLGALLQRARLSMPVADLSPRHVEYDSPLHLMRELRAMGETNALAQRDARFLRRDVLTEALEIYAREFPGDNGRVRATFQFAFLTGWSPSASQPQPLRPGSASHRLAEALGTVEFDRDLNPLIDPVAAEKGDD